MNILVSHSALNNGPVKIILTFTFLGNMSTFWTTCERKGVAGTQLNKQTENEYKQINLTC